MSIRKSSNGNVCPIIFVEQPIMHDFYIDEDVTEKKDSDDDNKEKSA